MKVKQFINGFSVAARALVLCLAALCVPATALYAQTAAPRSYYVRANGDDNNNGRSEDAPFKTLAKAVDAAKAGVIKRITVLGKIVGESELTISNTGDDEILITGKLDAAAWEKAEIEYSYSRIFCITNAKIQFAAVSLSGESGMIPAWRIENKAKVTFGAGTLVLGGFQMSADAELTMTDDATVRNTINASDSSITMTGNARISNKYDGIKGSGRLTLTMSDNAQISGNTTSRRGGGIGASTLTLTMTGNSRISNNTASMQGGGVAADTLTLTMSDNAQISGNTTREPSGGGIASTGTLTLTMTGNSRISNNTAAGTSEYDGRGGGGIYAFGGKIAISGDAQISGNTAAEYGGGIFFSSGEITIADNARISGNTAGKDGGGVYAGGANNGVKLTINGGEISRNTAKNGAGVFVASKSSATMTGGTITGNKAEYGAGVYAQKGGAFTLNGGTITGNEAEFVGGGVYAQSGSTYTAGGGTVTDNTAGDGGANVFRQQ